MRIYPCRHFDDMAMYVRYDGTVVPCSFNVHMCNEHAMDMGKLDKEQSLIEFYNNEKYQALRFRHYDRDFPWPCSKCAIGYTGDGLIGEVRFRNSQLSQKTVYYHDDYSNTFYSYIPRHTRVSFLRQWSPDEDVIAQVRMYKPGKAGQIEKMLRR
jgi:radical SAM protein with 4Fe4S-binding SPASM domain